MGAWLPAGAVVDGAWGAGTGSDRAGATSRSGWRLLACRSGNTGLARKAADTLLPNSLLGTRALVGSSKEFLRVQPGQATIRIRTDTIHVGIAGNRTGKFGSSNDGKGRGGTERRQSAGFAAAH